MECPHVLLLKLNGCGLLHFPGSKSPNVLMCVDFNVSVKFVGERSLSSTDLK